MLKVVINKKNRQSRETKQKHNAICVGHHFTHTNTYKVNKTWALIQTTGCILQ